MIPDSCVNIHKYPTMWGPLVISLFIHPSNYGYKLQLHKPKRELVRSYKPAERYLSWGPHELYVNPCLYVVTIGHPTLGPLGKGFPGGQGSSCDKRTLVDDEFAVSLICFNMILYGLI